MHRLAQPDLAPWQQPKETELDLDWAPLAIIDLAKWDTPGGKESLALELTDPLRNIGFWVVKNSGIPQEAMVRQFSLANTFFNLPSEEKNEVTFVAGKYGAHGLNPQSFTNDFAGVVLDTDRQGSYKTLHTKRISRW